MIPKIIWQTYKCDYEDLPDYGYFNLKGWAQNWIDKNPGYEYRYYNDAEMEKYILSFDPELKVVLDFADELGIAVMKADLFRYVCIHNEGGFYADIDTQCNVPIDDWHNPEHHLILSPDENGRDLEQWFFGATKKNPVMKRVVDNVKKKVLSGPDIVMDGEFGITGNTIFTKSIFDYLNVPFEEHLLDLSGRYNETKEFVDNNIFIYKNPKTFKENLVSHEYASMHLKHEEYTSWQEAEKTARQKRFLGI